MANILSITPRAPEWNAQTPDALEDLDEPPEKMPVSAFARSTVRQPTEQASLLTKAILAQSDEETPGRFTTSYPSQRRRSMTSNISIASTADLTSDTGYTSPSRVSTPSPPTHHLSILHLHSNIADNRSDFFNGRGIPLDAAKQPANHQAPRKRCIQFACGAKPNPYPRSDTITPPASRPVSAQEAQEPPRRPTSIKFACQARPAQVQPSVPDAATQHQPSSPIAAELSATSPKKGSTLSACGTRPPLGRKPSNRGAATRPRFLRATSGDLSKDGSQFHEFASGIAREDDWIRNDSIDAHGKLTISDTLCKENRIRRLATEVEEEEAQLEDDKASRAVGGDNDEDDDCDEDNDDDDEEEEDEDNEEDEDDDHDDDVDDDDEEDDEEDEDRDHDLDVYDAEFEDGNSDGYHTDEETGFADSDEDDDGDENMIMWTLGHPGAIRRPPAGSARRLSTNEQHSDSSANSRRGLRRAKARPIGPTAEATDLPDSTDFVCGTLDEDKPLEEVFMSCLAARRQENLRVIPQDIDPSFPASDLDEEDEEDSFNAAHAGSDPNVWAMDDLHHDQDRSRRQKGDLTPPRRLRSPPPAKRHQSPPSKVRGRSPKLLFECHSPRRARSPAPRAMVTPLQTPRQGAHVQFNLAGRPGLTQTKSLPKPAALFRCAKQHKSFKFHSDDDVPMRGAIDIVKGLEKKRQRRKEKFMQKYCDRARRGQIPERKPLPGLGAERMKEVGLIMAGKKDPGNYVLSF